ncbi:hypothetical protein AcW1_003396 [Taiwanofungus camphoratus]|nr:hypothetical protein AcW1_003396 [Antrodia cinnamomea]
MLMGYPTVKDRYQQFLRVTRQWSHLKDLMQHGFGYPSRQQPGEGDLAFFCAACPQSGVNLDPDWKEHSDQSVYTRGFIMDGNFSAEHLKMRRPRNDVEITDSTSFFVADGRYKAHLQPGTCHNHKAVNLANADWHKLESTGIGATAYPRHGCFVPHSVVDFQKGERQMNINYSLSNAIGYNTKDIGRMLLLYDINCQYGQYLLKQFQQNPYLQMPKGLKIVKGISLFHVHGHQDACFIGYSPSFIPGTSLVDGEILKTLWSSLNKVSSSTRGMATSHQKEVLNRHMNDSNWKKIINTVSFLQRKYKNIKPILTDTKRSYQAMEASIDLTLLVQWKQQMGKAQ